MPVALSNITAHRQPHAPLLVQRLKFFSRRFGTPLPSLVSREVLIPSIRHHYFAPLLPGSSPEHIGREISEPRFTYTGAHPYRELYSSGLGPGLCTGYRPARWVSSSTVIHRPRRNRGWLPGQMVSATHHLHVTYAVRRSARHPAPVQGISGNEPCPTGDVPKYSSIAYQRLFGG